MSMSGESQKSLPQTYEAVSPIDIVSGRNTGAMFPPNAIQERKSSESSTSSLKACRVTRFAEAETIHSPAHAADLEQSPFADPPEAFQTLPNVSDVGFGYVAASDPAHHASHHDVPSPGLKSALKVPGTPGRTLNPLSPTFREEFYVEKQEKVTEKENARDLVSQS